MPNRGEPDKQLAEWKSWASISDKNFDAMWDESVRILDENQGADGTGCMTCDEPPSDVVLIIDESGSISLKGNPRYFSKIHSPCRKNGIILSKCSACVKKREAYPKKTHLRLS